jgi:hypothetical protein
VAAAYDRRRHGMTAVGIAHAFRFPLSAFRFPLLAQALQHGADHKARTCGSLRKRTSRLAGCTFTSTAAGSISKNTNASG